MNESKLRILLVDDSSSMRHIVKGFVQSEFKNFEFFEAGNGQQAEEILQDQEIEGKPIDGIFLDWMMPEVSGLEFLKKIRSTEVFRDHPWIIMLTAETYVSQINECLKYGVKSYITKPFTKDSVCRTVYMVLSSAEVKHVV